MEPDIIRKFFLKANPNPGREGCPDRDVLKGIANNTLPPDHPARFHLASCSPCFAEFRELKQAKQGPGAVSRRGKLFTFGAIAACLALLLGGFALNRFRASKMKPVLAPIARTVDLYNVGTFRGLEPNKLADSPVLPTRFVKLRVVLPRFSGPGRYRVGIAQDKSGKNLVAEASAGAVTDGDRQVVTVLLDLRSVPLGVYLLSTTHDDDQASYYYPVKIAAT